MHVPHRQAAHVICQVLFSQRVAFLQAGSCNKRVAYPTATLLRVGYVSAKVAIGRAPHAELLGFPTRGKQVAW